MQGKYKPGDRPFAGCGGLVKGSYMLWATQIRMYNPNPYMPVDSTIFKCGQYNGSDDPEYFMEFLFCQKCGVKYGWIW